MIKMFIVALAVFAVLAGGLASGHAKAKEDLAMHTHLAGLPKQPIDEKEKAGMILMREEEKLARDVYLALGQKWGIKSFKNIAESEKTHMAAVKSLLDRYGLEDPAANQKAGEFKDPKLQTLYGDLVEKGSKSPADALQVGALIEELDIADLQKLIRETDNEDLKLVYGNLLKGSKNHLRAFNRQLQRRGIAYQPRHISQEEYDSIVKKERKRAPARG